MYTKLLYPCIFSIVSSLYLPLSFATWQDLFLRSRVFLWSSSSFSLVITTLLGQMPTWAVVPFAFSHCTRSMQMTYFCQSGLFCQYAVLHSVTGQPARHHPYDGQRLHGILLPQLFGKRVRYDLPTNMGRHIEMPFTILAPVRSHKGTELHFGCWCFSNGHKREEDKKWFYFKMFSILWHHLVFCSVYIKLQPCKMKGKKNPMAQHLLTFIMFHINTNILKQMKKWCFSLGY